MREDIDSMEQTQKSKGKDADFKMNGKKRHLETGPLRRSKRLRESK